MFHDLKLIDSNSLLYYDNLYLIKTVASFNESLHLSVRRIKRKLINKNSAALWYKRLGIISKWRIKRFVSNKILDPLNFTNSNDCINCIKKKQTNKRRFETNKTLDVLELVYIDICESFSTSVWNDQQYCIMFINKFLRYGYIYLISIIVTGRVQNIWPW